MSPNGSVAFWRCLTVGFGVGFAVWGALAGWPPYACGAQAAIAAMALCSILEGKK